MGSEDIKLEFPVSGQGLVMDLGVPARPHSSLLEALLQQVLVDALLQRYGFSPEDTWGSPAGTGAVDPVAREHRGTETAVPLDGSAEAPDAFSSSAAESSADEPVIPEDGAGIPSELAQLLAAVDPRTLDDAQAIDYLKAAARVEAWVQSCQVQALDRFAQLRTGQGGNRDPEGFSRFAPQEISAHLSTGEAAARTMLADARYICTHLPSTLQAVSSGDLDLARAKVMARGSADLPADSLEEFEAAVLPGAGNITVESVRSRARKMRDQLHPESLSERHRRANESRDVQLTDQNDGMTELWIRLSADKAHLVFDRIQSTARFLQGPGEERTLPQLRADVFSDLLLDAEAPAAAPVAELDVKPSPAPTGELDEEPDVALAARTELVPEPARGRPDRSAGLGMLVTMPLNTLLGLSEEPGDLAGHGPIPPDMGRQLSQLAKSWLLVLTDDQGQAIAAARKLRIPPEWLKRLVRVRDRHCRFPGCRRAAQYCEIDHVIAWQVGGLTVLENLQCLCVAHHAAKTAGECSAEAGPNGEITWTTRTGHRKTTFPDEGWETLLPRAAGGRAGDGKPRRTLGAIELPDEGDPDPNAPPPF
ncbi:DUF222 domain-containing protein [Arthrobacter sulfonylureivorans]|uniref:HNH endonuclease signature motif containing protein n=1 Tax=Arthrobacter sulfonylureivorans TaxID=2486855 RepID=UPI0039E2FF1E